MRAVKLAINPTTIPINIAASLIYPLPNILYNKTTISAIMAMSL